MKSAVLCFCSAVSGTLLFSSALAETASTDVDPKIKSLTLLDKPQATIAKSVTGIANWIDGFFGSNRIYQESQGSYLKLNLVRSQEYKTRPAYAAQVRGKLSLPKTQDRLKLLLESDPEESQTENQAHTLSNTLDDQQQTLGLRYIPFLDDQWRLNTDVGVRFRSGLDGFARVRLRRLFAFDSWSIRLSENLFWYDSTGAGETTRLEFDRPINPELLFRSASSATWMRETDYFDWGHDFLLYQKLEQNKLMQYQLGVRGISEPNVHATNYIASVRYRQRIHSDWLYFEFNPRVDFPEEDDFEPLKSFTIAFEVIFGDD